jgi:hypothetical protein
MNFRHFKNRLDKLERNVSPCPGTELVVRDRVDGVSALPPIEPGPPAEPCPKCGKFHKGIEILEIVVKSREDVARLDAQGYGDWKGSGSKG